MKTIVFVILCIALSKTTCQQTDVSVTATADLGTDSMMREAGIKKLEEVVKDQISTLYKEKSKDEKIENELKKERDSVYNAAEISLADKKSKLAEIQQKEMNNLITEYTEKLRIQNNTKDLKIQNLRKINELEKVDKEQKYEVEKQKGEKDILIRQQRETYELESKQASELKEITAKLNQKIEEIKAENDKLMQDLKANNKDEMSNAIKEAEKTLGRIQEKFGVDQAEADEMKKKAREEFIQFFKTASPQ